MFRKQLKGMSLKELQSETRRYGIMPLPKTIKSCIESIMAFMENENGQAASVSGSRENIYDDAAVPRENQDSQIVSNHPPLSSIHETSNIQVSSDSNDPQPGNTLSNNNTVSQLCALVADQMRHQQMML